MAGGADPDTVLVDFLYALDVGGNALFTENFHHPASLAGFHVEVGASTDDEEVIARANLNVGSGGVFSEVIDIATAQEVPRNEHVGVCLIVDLVGNVRDGEVLSSHGLAFRLGLCCPVDVSSIGRT